MVNRFVVSGLTVRVLIIVSSMIEKASGAGRRTHVQIIGHDLAIVNATY